MTKEQLHILQHALGVDQYGRGEMYRNRYVGGKEECRSLVAMGYMVEMKPRCSSGYDAWFMVTKDGIAAMREESPKPPKLSASQKRYKQYLEVSDALNCSFGEWLKMRKEPWYKEMNRG